MTNENKIIPNMKKEDEDEYEYEYILELEKFNNLPKQMTYKETWINIGKNLKNFFICSKENKSVTPVKHVAPVKNKVIKTLNPQVKKPQVKKLQVKKPQVKKPQVIQNQIIDPKNKT
jgi:hypothetical protein